MLGRKEDDETIGYEKIPPKLLINLSLKSVKVLHMKFTIAIPNQVHSITLSSFHPIAVANLNEIVGDLKCGRHAQWNNRKG